MSAADEKTEGKASSRGKTAEEDQFTKESAIAASRAIAGVSPHVMAGALWDKADDDAVTRQEAADAVAAISERPKDEEA
jgi:hypothetical protein